MLAMWYNMSTSSANRRCRQGATATTEGTRQQMNAQYISKTEAVIEIMQKTGYGRFVIEKRIETLLRAGQIRLIDDPSDRRRQLLSRQDVQTIIDSLTLP